jgi:2,4-dienoyl-CoA reductase-like NADH-dependent reductase (Old Yellow Enzyme family)
MFKPLSLPFYTQWPSFIDYSISCYSWGEHKNSWGIIVTGNITISYTHIAASGDPIIIPSSPLHGTRFERFKALASAAKANGSLIIGQVNHPGRQVREKYSGEAISSSAVPLGTSLSIKASI